MARPSAEIQLRLRVPAIHCVSVSQRNQIMYLSLEESKYLLFLSEFTFSMQNLSKWLPQKL